MATVTPEIKRKVRSRIDECIEMYEQFTGQYYSTFIPVDYKAKGRSAGIAYVQKGIISLNLEMMLCNDIDNFIHNTVAHEVAHLIAYNMYSDTGHGRWWKMVMRMFNLNPERCHNYNMAGVTVRRQKRWIYRCSCRTHEVSTTRHNKMVNGANSYSCRICGSVIIFTGKQA